MFLVMEAMVRPAASNVTKISEPHNWLVELVLQAECTTVDQHGHADSDQDSWQKYVLPAF